MVSEQKDVVRQETFPINLRTRTITCPAGQTKRFHLGQVVSFDPAVCGTCSLRPRCTKARQGAARAIHIARDEALQKRLWTLVANDTGRARRRERVTIEHRLAHLARKQGRRARYLSTRKNLFDLRRYSAQLNLETIHRRETVQFTKAAQWASNELLDVLGAGLTVRDHGSKRPFERDGHASSGLR